MNESAPQGEPVADLHPATADLVVRFSQALYAKLAEAQKKYGYTDGWRSTSWLDECRAHLMAHIAKGDPRDVAAYCAFLWHHGASTATEQAPATPCLNPLCREGKVARCEACRVYFQNRREFLPAPWPEGWDGRDKQAFQRIVAATQAAPSVAATEREAFEAAMRKMWTLGYAFPRNRDGDYLHANCDLAWRVWQARAALPLPAVVQAAHQQPLGNSEEQLIAALDHPAAPQTSVPTAAPRSEPRALGQGELPVEPK